MDIEPVYLLYGVIFLTVLLLVEGAYYFFVESTLTKRRTNRRLSMLSAGMEGREVLDLLRRQPSREGSVNPLIHPLAYLDSLIAASGLSISRTRVGMFIVLATSLAAVGLQAAQWSGRLPLPLSPLHFQGAIALLLGIALPIVYLSRAGRLRKQKFAEQLPDALDVMVRSLRAGHPINAAMGLVAKEMSDPMGTEFGIAVDEMTYGLGMHEALENLGDRIQSEEFNYVVMSIGIQHETGGNLAGVLASLAYVIRARARMFLKVRALSSEGRMSALVLCALPFVVGGVIFAGNPGYYTKYVGDPLFLPILFGAIFNLVLGIYMIHRMVNFRV